MLASGSMDVSHLRDSSKLKLKARLFRRDDRKPLRETRDHKVTLPVQRDDRASTQNLALLDSLVSESPVFDIRDVHFSRDHTVTRKSERAIIARLAELPASMVARMNISFGVFEKLRQYKIDLAIQKAKITRVQRMETITQLIDARPAPAVRRLIIGAGGNATAAFASLPFDERTAHSPSGLPQTFCMGKVDQWEPEGDEEMGQNWRVQSQRFFLPTQPQDLMPFDDAISTDTFVRSSDFTDSLHVSQDELEMPIYPELAGAVQAFHPDKLDWHRPDYEYRVPIVDQPDKYIYAHFVDITVGVGPSRVFSTRQLSEKDSAILTTPTKHGYTPIVYGGKYVGSDAPPPGSTVIVYGGGPRATACAQYAQKNGCKVILWAARNEGGFELANPGRWSCETALDKSIPRLVADLDRITVSKEGHVLMYFDGQGPIECHQLAAAIGQNTRHDSGPLGLISELPLMTPLLHLDTSGEAVRALGTQTPDGRVRCLGATGTLGFGLDPRELTLYNHLVSKEARSFPFESTAQPSVYRSLLGIQIANGAQVAPDINCLTGRELLAFTGEHEDSAQWIVAQRQKMPFGFKSARHFSTIALAAQAGLGFEVQLKTSSLTLFPDLSPMAPVPLPNTRFPIHLKVLFSDLQDIPRGFDDLWIQSLKGAVAFYSDQFPEARLVVSNDVLQNVMEHLIRPNIASGKYLAFLEYLPV
ncbi:MAG: hypothetical protein ACI9BD_000007 [Candidatus Marinamargulisbacteria bacterium]|jgi:hypothetical protein